MNLEVDYLATTDLTPYANNPRTHSDQQIDQLAASIEEFGFNNPILADEHNVVLAGHGRLKAAQKLNLKLVPVINISGLTEEQRIAYVITDNKLGLNSGWDDEMLKLEIERLNELDFDLGLMGWAQLPEFNEEIDYSILDDDNSAIDQMAADVKKSILIDFEPEKYEEAFALVKKARQEGINIGKVLTESLHVELFVKV